MTPTSGISRRICCAARSPSSVCVGGIRMSVTATAGLCARTLRSRSSASDACAATSKPASSSSRARPARSRTESSASTIFMAQRFAGAERSGQARMRSSAAPQTSCLATKPRAPDRAAARRIQRIVGARRHDHGGPVAVLGQRQRDREAVHVGQPHVEQDDVGLERQRRAQTRPAVGRLARRRRSRRPRAPRGRSCGRWCGRRRSGLCGTHCDSRHTALEPQYGRPYPRGGQPNLASPAARRSPRVEFHGPGGGSNRRAATEPQDTDHDTRAGAQRHGRRAARRDARRCSSSPSPASATPAGSRSARRRR